jgi:predicted branched-subunit amino acid permease
VAVAATVWFFGASFGLVARAAGMGAYAPLVMSATTFAGSAQFAVSSILGASGGTAAAITAAVLLNARYAPISISVASLFHGPLPRRLAESQLIVDESWGSRAVGWALRQAHPDRGRAAALRRVGERHSRGRRRRARAR